MTNLLDIAIIILASIVHSSLQLSLGSLLLLYHESAGKHIVKKTRHLVRSFISGVSIITLLLLSTACFIVSNFFGSTLSIQILSIIIGILVSLAIIMWFFYYRRGRTTELWLPKIITKFISNRAKLTNSPTEAFSLGVMTGFAELPFLAIIFLIASSSVLELTAPCRPLLVVAYALIVTIPLIILNIVIRTGRNVVDIQKWRVHNKLFLRIISGIGFLTLAIFLFTFKIFGAA